MSPGPFIPQSPAHLSQRVGFLEKAMTSHDELLARTLRLNHELKHLRENAQGLPLDDIRRQKYLLRALWIGQRLKEIEAERIK